MEHFFFVVGPFVCVRLLLICIVPPFTENINARIARKFLLIVQKYWPNFVQESPPAWTQEAYRPPRTKYSLCWCVCVGGAGGTPSTHGGGYPSRPGQGGYPIQSWPGGYPIQSWWGVPPTSQTWPGGLGGFPGYPPIIQTWPGGDTPHHPDLARGTLVTLRSSKPGWGSTLGAPPTIKTWPGYPSSRSGWGVPPTIMTWPGYPPSIQTWLGYPPPSRPGQGTLPPPSRPDWGTPPSRPGWDTPPPIEVWTDKQTENSTFPHPSDAGGNYWVGKVQAHFKLYQMKAWYLWCLIDFYTFDCNLNYEAQHSGCETWKAEIILRFAFSDVF